MCTDVSLFVEQYSLHEIFHFLLEKLGKMNLIGTTLNKRKQITTQTQILKPYKNPETHSGKQHLF